MSFGRILNQCFSMVIVGPGTRRAINSQSLRGCRSFFCLAVAGALLGGCEQQVANAEQPSVAKESTNQLKGDIPKPSDGDRGKLVFDKPACQLPNNGGDVTGECTVIGRVSAERKGHLTFGPYLPLPTGEYAFELEYRSSADAAAAAGRWDVAARLGTEEQVVAKGDIMGTGNDTRVLTGRFTMPADRGGVPVLEVRAAPSSSAETEIMRLRIYEVASGQ